ncbi:cation-transporting P-type ATPase, partial [Chloroflexota bacterium]
MTDKKDSQTAEWTSWYQLPVSEVVSALATNEAGLTSAETQLRLKKYGYNELVFKSRG